MTLPEEFFNALRRGDRAAVEMLLAQDAGLPAACNDQGVSAVLLALYYQEPEIAGLLARQRAQLNVFEAAALGRVDDLAALVGAAPKLAQAFSGDGFQPLGLAAFFGQMEAAAWLVTHGAPLDVPSRNGMQVMPLHSAVAGRHLDLARLLLIHGARVNPPQADGFTPLHGAAQNGQEEMIRLLLAYGAELNPTSADGQTPLDLALAGDHHEAAHLLVHHGGKRNGPKS